MAEEMGSGLVCGSMILPHAVMRNLSGRNILFNDAVLCWDYVDDRRTNVSIQDDVDPSGSEV